MAGLVAAALIALMGALGLAATAGGRQWLHRVDAQLLGERAMDTLMC